jgi:hypothetical protein
MYTLLKTIPNHWPDGADGVELPGDGEPFVVRPEEARHYPLAAPGKRQCASCKRTVEIGCTHGPGPRGEFICPGSGDQARVAAAAHLTARSRSA